MNQNGKQINENDNLLYFFLSRKIVLFQKKVHQIMKTTEKQYLVVLIKIYMHNKGVNLRFYRYIVLSWN